MATMKSYSDLQQSKKLAEILPPESADMHYNNASIKGINYVDELRAELMEYNRAIKVLSKYTVNPLFEVIPCWSLAALLDVLSKSAYFINEAGIVELSSIKATKWCVSILNCGKIENCYADDPIDACYQMIIRLNELNLL